MNAAVNKQEVGPKWLDIVAGQVASLRFGVVQIVVHESRVVQIDKTEKVRLERAGLKEKEGD